MLLIISELTKVAHQRQPSGHFGPRVIVSPRIPRESTASAKSRKVGSLQRKPNAIGANSVCAFSKTAASNWQRDGARAVLAKAALYRS